MADEKEPEPGSAAEAMALTRGWLGRQGCLFWGVAAVGALYLLARCSPEEGLPDRSALLAGTMQAVTARELFAAYQANEVAAQQRFGSGGLEVSGEIESVTLDVRDRPVVAMRGGGPAQLVSVNFPIEESPTVAALRQGQQLTVRCGKVTELMGLPVLTGCVIKPG